MSTNKWASADPFAAKVEVKKEQVTHTPFHVGEWVGNFHCIADEVEGKHSCQSSDANSVYQHDVDDEVYYDSYCRSCDQCFTRSEVHGSTLAVSLGLVDGKVVDGKKLPSKPKPEPLTRDEVKSIIREIGYNGEGYRGIEEKYNRFYGHLTKLGKNGQVAAQYYPETKDGVVVGYKSRIHPKSFGYDNRGRTGVDSELSGQIKFKAGGKYILITGGECYSPDTDILTDRGWVSIAELNDSDLVMQASGVDGCFVKPERLIKKFFKGDMVTYRSTQMDLMVTPDHKMIGVNSKGDYDFTASNGPSSSVHLFRKSVSASGDGLVLADNQIRFILALSADAKVDTRKSGKKVAHFAFVKDRKIERLRWLLDDLGLVYTEFDKESHDWVSSAGSKYHTFNVVLPEWAREKGIPEKWLSQASLEQKTMILDELILWDGNNLRDNWSFEFSTKLRVEADTVQALAVTSNYHASIRHRSNQHGAWYVVRVSKKKNTGSYQAVKINRTEYEGFVYCVTVPSGKIVVRRNNKVVVCGNCDKVSAYQMLANSNEQRGGEGYDPIAVVSPTTGESSAHKQIANNYDFFDQFDFIVIGMDNDKVGKEAALKIASVLPAEKVKIATWSMKDPNKMLTEGKQKQFVRDFYAAKDFIDSGIKTALDAVGEVAEFLTAPKISLPAYLHRLEDNMRGGIRSTGAIVNIIGDTSIGKCLGVNTPVWMYDNSVKMVQDVVVGDILMGPDGTPRKVLTTTTGREEMFKIHQQRGMDYVVNKSHTLSLRAGYDCLGSDVKKGQIVNLSVDDYVSSGNKLKRSLKGYKADTVKFGEGVSVKHPWLLGLWLADGCSSNPIITVNVDDVDLIQALEKECMIYGYTLARRKPVRGGVAYRLNGGFLQFLRDNNLLSNKHIPDKYLNSCYSDRAEIMAGLLDGDGYLVSNGYEITQKSDGIADGIAVLCRSLCLEHTTKKVKKGCQNDFVGEYNRMFVYGRVDRLPLRLERKRVASKSDLRLLINTAITVESIGVGDYYGFSVDVDHLFCLGDGTVTHNSFFGDNLMLHWFYNSPLVPTVISLERTAGEFVVDLYSLHLKKNLIWFKDGDDALKYLDRPEVKALCADMISNEEGISRFNIIDERNGSVDSLKKQVDIAIKKYGSKLIIFDPLTDFLRALGTEAQEDFMMWEKMKKKEGIVFLNILHTRKPPTDKDGGFRKATEYDALGSGTFVQSADINIVLNRDKMSNDPVVRNTSIVDMPKCRGGVTGTACELYYDHESRQQYDKVDFMNENPVDPIPDYEYVNTGDATVPDVVNTGTGEVNRDEFQEEDF